MGQWSRMEDVEIASLPHTICMAGDHSVMGDLEPEAPREAA